MFMVAVEKKLAQNMGTSNSGLAKTAKSKICINFQRSVITEGGKQKRSKPPSSQRIFVVLDNVHITVLDTFCTGG
jgi:hypothetical protein